MSSFRFCVIEFENPESALAAKQDLDKNRDINVNLRKKEDPVKQQEMKRKRKMRFDEKQMRLSEEFGSEECSLYISFPYQKRPLPDVIRKLHPKIIDVRVPRSKNAKLVPCSCDKLSFY